MRRFRCLTPRLVRADGLLHMDWLVGQLLNTIDSLGISSNTIVLLTSDNGLSQVCRCWRGGKAIFRPAAGWRHRS